MTISIEAWLLNVDGRKIDRDGGFPAKDPYQCWDLWADYAERVEGVPLAATFTNYGGSAPHPGYACNVFHNASKVSALTSRFTIADPSFTAQPGDVAFWEKGGIYAGSHVAIVTADLGNRLRCMSQNKGPGHDASAYETLSKSTLLGYLRPRSKATAPATPDRPANNEKDFLMALTDAEQRELLDLARLVRGDQVFDEGRQSHMAEVRKSLARLETRGTDLAALNGKQWDVLTEMRRWMVHPMGFTYFAAMLPILQRIEASSTGTTASLAELLEQQTEAGTPKVDLSAEDVAELAAALRQSIGDDVVRALADALTRGVSG